MTKELNLFLGETKETSTTKVSSVAKTEKSSNSMFDKILLDINKENETLNNETNSKPSQNRQNSTNQIEVTIEKNNESNVIETKTNKITQLKKDEVSVEDKQLNKTINDLGTKEVKGSNEKLDNSTLSLLDRMMLEANTKINTETNTETNKESKTNNNQSANNTTSPLVDEELNKSKNILNKIENNETTNIKSINPSENISSDVKNIINAQETPSDTKIETFIKEENINIENDNNKEKSEKIEKDSLKVSEVKETQVHSFTEISKNNVSNEEIDLKQNDNIKNENLKSNNILKDEVKPKIEVEHIISKEINIVTNEKKENVVDTNQDVNKNSVLENKENTKTNVNDNLIKDVIVEEKSINKKDNIDKEEVVVTKKEIEVKTIIKDEIKTTNIVEKTVVKNENVANELSKIIKSDIDIVVDITKEEIEKLPDIQKSVKTEITNSKEPQKISLLDKLIEESKQLSKNQNNKIINKEEISIDIPKTTELTEKQNNEKNVNSFFTNMYLSSQKNNLHEASIVKVAIGKKILNDATSIKDVEKSAEFLDLGFEDSEVTVKMQEVEKHTKLNILDKMAFIKTVMKDDLINNNALLSKYSTVGVTSTANIINTSINAENETVVQLNVSPTNVMNIESRIIGARQQMGTMMSEVARNMYLNYKPPVTAFRINLTPGNLGSIAILMKNDKENGLTISLNMSNTATLDSFVDNQASLRAALAKNFDTNANFTLDFNMQDQNSNTRNKENNQNNQNTNSSNQDLTEVQDVMNTENQESLKTDYM